MSMIGVIDIETTGFSPTTGFVVEVGLVSLDSDTGEVKVLVDQVCREKGMTAKDRKAWIFKNSTLTVEEVRDAPDLVAVLDQVQKHVDELDGLTAYNKAFDFAFLKARRLLIPVEYTCPMIAAMGVLELPFKGGKRPYRCPKDQKFKWPSVEEVWKHFFPDRPYEEMHRGADDAVHEAKILHELIKLGLISSEEN